MPKEPVHFCRFQDDTSVDKPVFGYSGTRSAALTYAAAQFGSGWQDLAAQNNNIILNCSGTFYCSPSTIEFWFCRKEQSSSGKYTILFYDSPTNGGDATHFQFRIQANSTTSSTAGMNIDWLSGGGSRLWLWSFTGFATIFPIDEWVHIGVVTNQSEAADIDKLRLYRNGTEYTTGKAVTKSATAPNALNTMQTTNIMLSWTTGNVTNGIMDNLKIYDYIKTDFTDRFNERGGLNDHMYGF